MTVAGWSGFCDAAVSRRALGVGQSKGVSQGADRRRVGAAMLSPLQPANGVGRQSSPLGQFLLRQSGRLASTPQTGAKSPLPFTGELTWRSVHLLTSNMFAPAS